MTAMDGNHSEPRSDETRALPAITSRYLLVINIPLHRDSSGRLFADQLWFKDLAAHLSYLRDFAIACPVVAGSPPKDAIALSDAPSAAEVKVIPLPPAANLVQAVAFLPVTLIRLWRAIAAADLVHSGVAGWPFPLGWLAIPLARLLRRRTLLIVESAPWRLQPGLPASMAARIRAGLYERLARWCMRSTDLAIFTQEEYRRSLLPGRSGSGHVIHASWIDESVVLSDQQAQEAWQRKALQESTREIRFLFAGRLDAEKGVLVLLEAMTLIAKKDLALRLDILGTGKLAPDCKAVSENLTGATRLQLLGTVSYGAPLFELLRGYHALIVPSISDEQPRIVYDGYSQAVPVIGTSTAGLRDCVREDDTGWLVRPGDGAALAGALERAREHPDQLQRMGLRAAMAARAMTHQAMHRQRQLLLLRLLEQPGSQG
jgi:glycosyltransferase involved in cell wall biosynthesis